MEDSHLPSGTSFRELGENVLGFKQIAIAGHLQGDYMPAKLFHSFLSENYKSASHKICAFIEDSKLEEAEVFKMASSVYDKLQFDS